MKKYTITIEVETYAPLSVMEEIEFLCGVQVESLDDGTLDMGDEDKPNIVNYPYTFTTTLKEG